MYQDVIKTVPKASITPIRSNFTVGGCFLFIHWNRGIDFSIPMF